MKQLIPVVALIAAVTSGCTVALGTAYRARPEHTQDRLQLDELSCLHEVDLGWGSFGHQFAQFMLWPLSIPWERSYKRDTWQRCMVAKGYVVARPDGKFVPGPQNERNDVVARPANVGVERADFNVSQPASERCTAIKDVDAYISCLHEVADPNRGTAAARCASLRCPDGSPGLWTGQAKSLGLSVGIEAYFCRTSSSKLEGQWSCSPIQTGVGCVTDGGILKGTTTDKRIKLESDHVPGGRVSSCRFDGSLADPLILAGDYACSGAIGETKGTFELRRCP